MKQDLEHTFSLVVQKHAHQIRKASIVPGAPYISHLLEVAGMVLANGGDIKTAEAALCHDMLEDISGDAADDIQEICGPDVLQMVMGCTEIGTGNGGEFKAPWKERKLAYLEHLLVVSPGALLISVADKLQSLRELKRQVRIMGDTAYEAFAKKEYAALVERKKAVLWFHCELSMAFRQRLLALQAAYEDVPMLLGIQALLDDFDEIVAFCSNV